MNQLAFTRRYLMQSTAAIAGAAAAGRIPGVSAAEAKSLKLWAAVPHKVGAKDWSAMEAQAGIKIAYTTKSARADEAIQKMVVGDGNKLFDAITDNGGGMEDAPTARPHRPGLHQAPRARPALQPPRQSSRASFVSSRDTS